MSLLNRLKKLFPNGKQSSGSWYNITCPFCQEAGFGEDTGKHLGLNYKLGYTNCWRCKKRIKLTWFLESRGYRLNEDELVFESSSTINQINPEILFPENYVSLFSLIGSDSYAHTKALDYAELRLGLPLAIKLSVGFCETGKYANRIIVPMFDSNDNIIYFIARSVFKYSKPKILNPPGQRRSILFNWNTAKNFSEIYLMEGVFGAVVAYPYGVATLGKEITEEQILLILKSKVKIINVVLDGNAIPDAYSVAERILSYTNQVRVRVLELKKETQPDDFDLQYLIGLKRHYSFYRGNLLNGRSSKSVRIRSVLTG
jgi:hypothetical protein